MGSHYPKPPSQRRRRFYMWVSSALFAGGLFGVSALMDEHLNLGCSIKGNISTSGERVYHLSDQDYYTDTWVDTMKGERWFCSEEEARSAGWRRSKV